MAEYADYHQAMAQHAAGLVQSNQLHGIGQLGQIQMQQLMSSGLNLTVMSGGLTNNNTGQHQLAHHGGHHVMYANVQAAQTQGGGGGGHGGGGGGGGGHGSHKKQKKPKVNKDGVPAPKRATTAYINFTQWYREELKKSGRPIPKVSPHKKINGFLLSFSFICWLVFSSDPMFWVFNWFSMKNHFSIIGSLFVVFSVEKRFSFTFLEH
jgi:hypothetical protein